MSREVLSIQTDDGYTVVKYRVEGFHNFGARMEELVAQHLEQRHGIVNTEDGPVAKDEEALAEIERAADDMTKLLGGLLSDAKGKISQIQKQIEGVNISDRAKASTNEFLQSMASAGSVEELLNNLGLSDNEEDEYDDEVVDEEEQIDPSVLEVCFEEPMSWSPELQSRVDRTLDAWAELRPKVLAAVFDTYKLSYDDIWAFVGGDETDRIVFPEPSAPSAIENLFRVTSIHLGEDENAIGLAGDCTWDDEHGIGIRIEEGKVIEAGSSDTAYPC